MFSEEESIWLNDADWFPRKREMMDRLAGGLESLRIAMASDPWIAAIAWPAGTDCSIGKLSRGENYQGQPWMLLDFPRKMSKEGISGFRTLFLWGHGITCILHLGGNGLDPFRSVLAQKGSLWMASTRLSVKVDPGTGNPWEYRLEQPDWEKNARWGDALRVNHWRIGCSTPLHPGTVWPVNGLEIYQQYSALLTGAG